MTANEYTKALHRFIYTDKAPGRYYRHIVFWSCRYIFMIVSAIYGAYLLIDRSGLTPTILLDCACELGIEMGYTYFIACFCIPKLLLRRKPVRFILCLAGATIGTIAAIAVTDHAINSPEQPMDLSPAGLWGTFWGNTGYGPPAVCAIFVLIRAIKAYSLNLDEKRSLMRENEQAESLLLKAQVHPHFLFNTLNNIYSFTQTEPDTALQLIESLGSTIRYMTTDCSIEYIPLEKELQLINDYIRLEKVRYGKRLQATVRVEGDPGDKYIDPLLLIPVVENCFKHGASQLIEDPWIKMHLIIEDTVLWAVISNNKPQVAPERKKKGIGLENVRSRLKLLHPGDHLLEISSGVDDFLIRLRIPLQTAATSTHLYQPNE